MTPEIKRKIVGEANWRSTNGHGGVDDITRNNFILAAEFGYQLAKEEIGGLKSVRDTYNELNNRLAEDLRTVNEQLSEKDKTIAEGLLLYQNQTNTIMKQEKEIERLKETIRKIYVHFGAGESRNPYVKPVIEICESIIKK